MKSFRSVLELHFPEAMVSDFEHLEASLQNDPKDRHVLAAAIKAQASTIVTFNLKDFQPEALAPCGRPGTALIVAFSNRRVVIPRSGHRLPQRRSANSSPRLLSGREDPRKVSQ